MSIGMNHQPGIGIGINLQSGVSIVIVVWEEGGPERNKICVVCSFKEVFILRGQLSKKFDTCNLLHRESETQSQLFSWRKEKYRK